MLRSLAACSHLDRIEAVWLIENGTDATEYSVPSDLKASMPLRHVVLSEPGQARARQWLVDELQHGFVIFLDSDLHVYPTLVEAYLSGADACGPGFIYGGPMEVAHEKPPPEWLRRHLPRSAIGWDPPDPEAELARHPWFMGGNFAAYCEDIIRVGGINVGLGPGASGNSAAISPAGHEVDLQYRMVAGGTRLMFLGDARVVHSVPRDRCTPEWALERIHRNRIRKGMASFKNAERLSPRDVKTGISAVLALLASRFVNSDEQRYLLRKKWYTFSGFLEGRRRAHAQHRHTKT